MSTLSTPTRIGRRLIVPGIDTKQPFDSVLSYGGLHTPPQSAHESRRPSIQYGALSEAPYSATSTSFGTYSHPVTPVHGLDREAFQSRWPSSIEAHETSMTTAPLPCTIPQIEQRSIQGTPHAVLSYQHSSIDEPPLYPNVDYTTNSDALGLAFQSAVPMDGSWRQPHEVQNGYMAPTACLGPALFPHGMDVPTNSPSSIFDNLGSSLNGYSYQDHPNTGFYVPRGNQSPPPLYAAPQVVVPSQVNPHDGYSDQHVSDYTSPHHSHEGFGNSFDSTSVPFGGFEMMNPPSPQDLYFAHSEDEDYIMVKAEGLPSPSFVPSSRDQSELPLRPKRRPKRPFRKAGNRIICRHDNGYSVVECEGNKCCVGLPAIVKGASSKKPFQCKFVYENGKECTGKFDRSEHLKRHEGMHSKERKYPCPLPKCNRKIGRPDNAGDHFKTHLRPKTAGKRNDHFEWQFVQDSIWAAYDDQKVAKKLIDGLNRWIGNGMPDTSGGKRDPRARL